MKNNIESVVSRIMNYPNINEIENNFQILKTYMNKQQTYNEELQEYDIAGPKMAESLEEDYSSINVRKITEEKDRQKLGTHPEYTF